MAELIATFAAGDTRLVRLPHKRNNSKGRIREFKEESRLLLGHCIPHYEVRSEDVQSMCTNLMQLSGLFSDFWSRAR